LEAYGSRATVFVLSDHGMHAVNQKGWFDPDDPPAYVNSADHRDAPPGFFLAAGPCIRRSPVNVGVQELKRKELESVGSVVDITPTILAMMRIPLGRDMDGRVLTEIFREDFQIERQPAAVASHDTADFLAGRERSQLPDSVEQERLEQLRDLGYIGGGEDDE
jgi:hypothetical protein